LLPCPLPGLDDPDGEPEPPVCPLDAAPLEPEPEGLFVPAVLESALADPEASLTVLPKLLVLPEEVSVPVSLFSRWQPVSATSPVTIISIREFFIILSFWCYFRAHKFFCHPAMDFLSVGANPFALSLILRVLYVNLRAAE
jgi:hypothetical protein